jgi:hypothetical protein
VGTVGDFVLRGPLKDSSSDAAADKLVLVSAQTGKTKSSRQLAEDVETLATGLAHDLQWSPNEPSSQGPKVIAILSENTVSYA